MPEDQGLKGCFKSNDRDKREDNSIPAKQINPMPVTPLKRF